MRLALVLAAPFPLYQGSQVFVADQARALRTAGAATTLFCYGAGTGDDDPGLPLVRTPPRLTPGMLRSSIHPAKSVADAALAFSLARAQRRQRFDALLAHNSEAAAIALLARPWLDVPIVYVVHTLLRYELSAYGPHALRSTLDAVGGALERVIARRADAILTLCEEARLALAPSARGPVAVIPPGLEPAPPPTLAACEAACRRHGLEPAGFVLYTGNVDRYQDLDRLDAAAGRLPGTPVVVATHDRRGAGLRGLRVVEVADADEMRALLHACAIAVLPRRRPGGFPVKLLNYLEAARPVVAFERVACGLEHGRTGWLLPEAAGAEDLARAIRTLRADPARAEAIGRAGRRHLDVHHGWKGRAAQTLELVQEARRRRAVPGRR
jgi:glycosyltransferase involved in cell wall biosynthesis